MRNPSGNVHSVPHAQEGRRVVRPRRAQAEPRCRLLREGPQQPRVLRVRRHRTTIATSLLSAGIIRAFDRMETHTSDFNSNFKEASVSKL